MRHLHLPIGFATASHWQRRFVCLALLLSLWPLLATRAWAQDDPPGRVGRLAMLEGRVQWFDHEAGQWTAAVLNRPLTAGDRLSTGRDARAELRVGSTTLRLAAASEVELVRLDDQRMIFQLHSGSLALRLRSRDIAAETELLTAEARLLPLRAGHYRLDRIDDTTQAGVWRGSLRLDDGRAMSIETGQMLEIWREARRSHGNNSGYSSGSSPGAASELRTAYRALQDDSFAQWVSQEDRREERTASSRYVSPEMTGAEDLDRYGRWEQHPEYGALWLPFEVAANWAPYQDGRWVWMRPWGWTWVDNTRWGFAPFHYGRWTQWRGRWAWSPGDYVVRPVFAPALVAWLGGPRLGVSITIGAPPVAWVPLAPREVFVPHYRHSPGYFDRIHPQPPPSYRVPGERGHWRRPEPNGFGNQAVPGAVTRWTGQLRDGQPVNAVAPLLALPGPPPRPYPQLPAPPVPPVPPVPTGQMGPLPPWASSPDGRPQGQLQAQPQAQPPAQPQTQGPPRPVSQPDLQPLPVGPAAVAPMPMQERAWQREQGRDRAEEQPRPGRGDRDRERERDRDRDRDRERGPGSAPSVGQTPTKSGAPAAAPLAFVGQPQPQPQSQPQPQPQPPVVAAPRPKPVEAQPERRKEPSEGVQRTPEARAGGREREGPRENMR